MKNRVSELRRSVGVSQDDFANSVGVSRQTVSSIENGKIVPSLYVAHRIAHYFGKRIEDVFIFDDHADSR